MAGDELREAWRAELDAFEAAGLRRTLSPLARGERGADFTSNDYLGLSAHPDVVEGAVRALGEHGAGARASRLLGGGSPLDEEVEAALAEWVGAEAALLFPTGYQANLGLLTTLAGPGDALLSDALMHASAVDACRLSRARVLVHGHGDLEHLEALLASARGARRRFVLTEGVFSMDGDRVPLAELDELCARHDAWLVVDEAHSLGVVGPEGAGAAAEELDGHATRLVARVLTGGKALGAAGGVVAGSRELRERLVNGARSFVYTTGIAPAVAGALRAAVPLARGASAERTRLREHATRLATRLGLPAPAAAILPVIVGPNEAAVELAERARSRGLEVRAVRPPTVPKGTARLRVVLHADSDPAAVTRLGDLLASELPRERPAAAPAVSAVALAETARPLVVAGTDTGIGKTVVSALLARALARRGPVRYWKPVQTGDDSDTDTVLSLCAGSEVDAATPAHHFPLPASPHEAAADAGAHIDFEALLARFDDEAARVAGARQLVAELAGGLLVPYDDAHTQLDGLARLRPRLVLVARSGLGTLNHTLLSLEALRTRGLEPEALLLVGPSHASNRETLRRMGRVARVLEVPPFEPLDGAALERWIDDHPTPLLP